MTSDRASEALRQRIARHFSQRLAPIADANEKVDIIVRRQLARTPRAVEALADESLPVGQRSIGRSHSLVIHPGSREAARYERAA